ncbi:hypothetical protein HHI36_017459 [Cryptolaemus montrouzieri]|uniref:Uncharacterized protein n=1 Tax=Cryptolaemus montrouzieri TaxID=559131 RepID=A0ABD2NMZ5_9CUCU
MVIVLLILSALASHVAECGILKDAIVGLTPPVSNSYATGYGVSSPVLAANRPIAPLVSSSNVPAVSAPSASLVSAQSGPLVSAPSTTLLSSGATCGAVCKWWGLNGLSLSAANIGVLGQNIHTFDQRIRHVGVPVPQPVPVIRNNHVPVSVPVPHPVPVNRPVPVEVPLPVNVLVPRPYPVTVDRPVPVGVKTPVYVPIPQPVPVDVPRPYAVIKQVNVPVSVPQPIHVNVPVRQVGLNNEVSSLGSSGGLGPAFLSGGYTSLNSGYAGANNVILADGLQGRLNDIVGGAHGDLSHALYANSGSFSGSGSYSNHHDYHH